MTAPGRRPRRTGPARSGADARAARSHSSRLGPRPAAASRASEPAVDRTGARPDTEAATGGEPTVRLSRPPDTSGEAIGRPRTVRPSRGRGPGPARSRRTGTEVVGRLSAGSPLPPPRRASRSTITRHVVLLALALFATAAVLAVPIRSFVAGRAQLSAELSTEQQLKDQLAALEQQKAALNDPNYLAELARERLQYVRPGDTVYVVHAAPVTVPSAPAPPKAPAAKSWSTNLWDTLAPPK